MKKTIGAVIGFLLILGAIGGGSSLQYLVNWSSGQYVGSNIATLAELLVGGYLVYLALIKRNSTQGGNSMETDKHW